jgi:hypothetical protein
MAKAFMAFVLSLKHATVSIAVPQNVTGICPYVPILQAYMGFCHITF